MNFFCIADANSAVGFRLAGVQTREVAGHHEAFEALRDALTMKDVGVILVTQIAASMIRNEINEHLYGQELPLILEIPSRGVAPEHASMGEFLKQAIGISL